VSEQHDEFEPLTPSGIGEAARALRQGERVLESEIEWRPRGVGAVLDLGFDLLRSRFASCFVLATVVWLPWRCLMVALAPNIEEMSLDPDRILASLAGAWTGNILAWVAQSIVTAFIARLLFDAASGRDAGVLVTMLAVVRRLPGLLVLGMLSVVLLVASLLACFFPILGMSWAITPMMSAYVIEDIGIGRAVQRSFKLSFEDLFSFPSFYAFWRWAGIFAVSGLFMMPLSGLVGVMEVPGARAWVLENWEWSDSTLTLVSIVVGSVLLGAATAVQASIQTAYYLDLRVRRDGVDLYSWLARLRGEDARAAERSVVP